jgi:hypothetical protein
MPLATDPVELASEPALVAPASTFVSPAIAQEPQGTLEWCWAACTVMVLRHCGNGTAQQGDVVNRFLGLTTCNLSPPDDACNQPAPIDQISAIYVSWGRNSVFVDGSVAFEGAQPSLATEMNAQRPVEIGFSYNGGGGHVALANGYSRDSVGPMVYVNDPIYGPGFVYYVNLAQAYGLGSWTWTWVSLQ